MKLFLDDLREPASCSDYMQERGLKDKFLYIDQDWVIIRNYEDFVDFIDKCEEFPSLVSFDHDLGEEKSGYDCLVYLCAFCLRKEKQLPTFIFHTNNPVGRDNMQSFASFMTRWFTKN